MDEYLKRRRRLAVGREDVDPLVGAGPVGKVEVSRAPVPRVAARFAPFLEEIGPFRDEPAHVVLGIETGSIVVPVVRHPGAHRPETAAFAAPPSARIGGVVLTI